MDGLKRQAAARALEHVRDGMKLGLGTGSTAKHFVELLGERVRAGFNVVGVPTSEATRTEAVRCGIPLTTLDDVDRLDLTVDGADEIDPVLNLIKGGVGATRRAIGEAFAQSGVSGQMVVRKGKDGHVFVTDGGHWIDDAHLGRIADAPRLAGLLALIPGVVEHGLFTGLASMAILAGAEGIRVVERR